MKNLIRILVLTTAAIPLLAQAPHAQRPDQRVLESYPVYSSGPLRYQVLVGPCGDVYCQIRVSVVGAEGELDFLVWEEGLLANSMAQRFDDDCWHTGRPDGFFATVCSRLVRLAPAWNGLILSQAAGADLPGQEHQVIAVLGDTLTRLHVFRHNMGGRTFSRIRIADADGDGVQEIANIRGTFFYSPDFQDQWRLKTFGWDAQLREFADLSETDRALPVYAAIFGSYETLAEARKEQEALDVCLRGLLQVLASDDFPMLRPGWFILAQLTTNREEAIELLEETKDCVWPTIGYVRRAQ